MAQIVSDTFREVIYSGEADNIAFLTIGNNEIDISNIESIKISDPIIDTSSQNFSLGSFIGKKIEISLKNAEKIDLSQEIYLEIGTKINNEYEMIPIGYFYAETTPEDYYQNANIVALDGSTKFKTNVDISKFFNAYYILTDDTEINSDTIYYTYDEISGEYNEVENPVLEDIGTYYEKKIDRSTAEDLLKSLCNYFLGENKLGTYPQINRDKYIMVYDNTLSGKQYISYIAEIMGGNAKITRDGKLSIQPLKQEPVVNIDATKGKSWKLGDKYEIKKITFFDAIRRYDAGNDTGNVMYIRQDNPFIQGEDEYVQEIINNIYNEIKDTIIYNIDAENYGDYSLDSWDYIRYNLDDNSYVTLNNTELIYQMNISSKVSVNIPSKQVEETTNIVGGTENQKYFRLKSLIDQENQQIEILASKSDTIEDKLGDTYNKGEIEQLIIDASNGLTNKFTRTGGNNKWFNTGLYFQKDDKTYTYWTGNVDKENEEKSASRTRMVLKSGELSQSITIPNGTYTNSFKYKKLINTAICTVTINNRTIELGGNSNDENYIQVINYGNEYIKTSDTTLDPNKSYYEYNEDINEYILVAQPIVDNIDNYYELVSSMPINIETESIEIKFNCNIDGGYAIIELMLNEGESPSVYSQNSNELITDTVTISDGIETQSTATNTISRQDSDGFRVLTKDDKKVTLKATDKGIETENVKANSGSIATVIISKIGNQTWITGV